MPIMPYHCNKRNVMNMNTVRELAATSIMAVNVNFETFDLVRGTFNKFLEKDRKTNCFM